MTTREEQSNNFLNSESLNDELFIEVVEKKTNLSREKFKVRLILILPATGKNENYLSVVYRCKINVELLDSGERMFVDVVMKAMLSNIPEIKEWSVFPREILLYENVIASFEKIWLDANETVEFGPKFIKAATEPYEIIILDDLKAGGYEMMNRKVGLDFEQTKLVILLLAKFHAASAIRYQKVILISYVFLKWLMNLRTSYLSFFLIRMEQLTLNLIATQFHYLMKIRLFLKAH